MIIPATPAPNIEPDLPEGVAASCTLRPDGRYDCIPATEADAEAMWWHIATWPEKVARVRWQHETGGTMWNGHKVRTDRESQGLILAATIRAQPVRWKFADSWADMTAQDMQSLADTVAAHIEACFAREEELQNNPDQDINAGWPTGWTE